MVVACGATDWLDRDDRNDKSSGSSALLFGVTDCCVVACTDKSSGWSAADLLSGT